MANMRKRHTAAFKGKVALEALKGEKAIAEMSSEYGVHSNQIGQWKKRLLDELPGIFSDRRKKKEKKSEELTSELYRQIGQLKVEVDWLKKKVNSCIERKRELIDSALLGIPVSRQCELLSLPRSTYYYSPREADPYNELLMRLIDEQYTKVPTYGVPRMTQWLKRQGHSVNHKRIARLMGMMGLEAIYPKRNLSKRGKDHKIYPYLLRGLTIDHPDQVWCNDITYIRLHQGFVYLVAVMDWYSRYVLSWELSVSMDHDFCVKALDKALEISRPEIFNTDQGSQFTSTDFTGRLKDHNIKISMDGRGRAFDNIFIERLWRTIKYEEVYLHGYQGVREAFCRLKQYLEFYDKDRLHSSLGYCTPEEIYVKERQQKNTLC